MSVNEEVKDAMKGGKLVAGSRRVIKMIKTRDIRTAVYSSNVPEDVLKDLNYYSKNFGIEIKMFKGNSRQLGEFCGKPFNITLLGIKK